MKTIFMISALAVLSACQPQEEYYPIETMIAGLDSYCAEGIDENSCVAQTGCEPTFSYEGDSPMFEVCVANPEMIDPMDDQTTGGTTGGDEPTLEDVVAHGCESLDSKYLWTKTSTQKGQVVEKVVKVKVCHQTGNNNAHSILIACPAVKAHVHHHDDYLGTCH